MSLSIRMTVHGKLYYHCIRDIPIHNQPTNVQTAIRSRERHYVHGTMNKELAQNPLTRYHLPSCFTHAHECHNKYPILLLVRH